ncbi:MAG: hypothetical protein LBF34_00140 [Puniceicoccales bacterium]|nr:hypothetical protein [Puniceicoccales bacterium]
MGYKKLLTNIVLGGVCLISLSFARMAPKLPKMLSDGNDANNDFPELTILEGEQSETSDDDDDPDRDETLDPDYAPLNTKERAMLLKIELQEKDHSLANLSYDARTILIPDARLTLLEMELYPEEPPPTTLTFDERLTRLERKLLNNYPQRGLDDSRMLLSEMGIPYGNNLEPLSLEGRADLTLEERITLLEMECGHEQYSQLVVRDRIEYDRDHSL